VHGATSPDDIKRGLLEECGEDKCFNAAITLLTYLTGQDVGENCHLLNVIERGDPYRGVWKYSLPYFQKHTGVIYQRAMMGVNLAVSHHLANSPRVKELEKSGMKKYYYV
jgi:hypothetical protein